MMIPRSASPRCSLARSEIGPLGFPRHVVLAGKVIQVKFAVGVLGADIFNRRIFGLFRYAAVLGRAEAKLIDLGIKIIDRRAEMQGVTQTHGNKQDVGKNQRVRSLRRNVITGENSLFLNACPVGLNHQVKLDLAQRLIVKGYVILGSL